LLKKYLAYKKKKKKMMMMMMMMMMKIKIKMKMKMKQAVIENILFNKKKEELKKNEVNVFKKN